jgi:hypothetical protein
MKFYESVIRRHHTSSRWALIGGALLWLSVAVTPTVQAAPIAYEIDNGFFSGTFTLDVADPIPFSVWSITPLMGPTFTQVSPTVLVNDLTFFSAPGLRQGTLPERFDFVAHPDFTYTAFWTPVVGGPNFVTGGGTYSAVPESGSVVLLAAGLLVLAGSRWLPSRREQQQLE